MVLHIIFLVARPAFIFSNSVHNCRVTFKQLLQALVLKPKYWRYVIPCCFQWAPYLKGKLRTIGHMIQKVGISRVVIVHALWRYRSWQSSNGHYCWQCIVRSDATIDNREWIPPSQPCNTLRASKRWIRLLQWSYTRDFPVPLFIF